MLQKTGKLVMQASSSQLPMNNFESRKEEETNEKRRIY